MNDKNKRPHLYYLKDKTPVGTDDLEAWAKNFERADRIVKQEKVGKAYVSTVFLGIDHQFVPEGKPVLFETMVFRGDRGGEMNRYCTWEEAEIGHREMVEKVTGENDG